MAVQEPSLTTTIEPTVREEPLGVRVGRLFGDAFTSTLGTVEWKQEGMGDERPFARAKTDRRRESDPETPPEKNCPMCGRPMRYKGTQADPEGRLTIIRSFHCLMDGPFFLPCEEHDDANNEQ